jgi:hypothetical protein
MQPDDQRLAAAAWGLVSDWPLQAESPDWDQASDLILQMGDRARCAAAMTRLESMYHAWQARERRFKEGKPFPLYSAGYTGLSHQVIAATLDYYEAVLVDVRFSTRSKVATWRGETLGKVFRGRYFWVQALGNVNYQTPQEGIRINNPADGFHTLNILSHAFPIVLLCVCPKVRECHRWTLAELASQDYFPGERVYHLSGKAPRLTIDFPMSLQL